MVRELIQRRWEEWLNRRIRRAPSVTLDQRRVFIFPSRVGLAFTVLLLLLLILAINYQNNLVFALTFWMFSLFLIAIFHTFANLSGLYLQAGAVSPVYVDDVASFTLILHSRGRARQAITVGWPEEMLETVWLEREQELHVSVPAKATRRGLFHPPRMLVESHFPLGLLRTWSWVALDWQCLVYPKPLWIGEMPPSPGEAPGDQATIQPWGEDFAGFHRYRPGDSLRRANWRAYAKEQPLMVRDYSEALEQELWLDWNLVQHLGLEQRLSALCAWALDCERGEVAYGLRLPGIEIAPGRGEDHLRTVLRKLALFDPPLPLGEGRGEGSR